MNVHNHTEVQKNSLIDVGKFGKIPKWDAKKLIQIISPVGTQKWNIYTKRKLSQVQSLKKSREIYSEPNKNMARFTSIHSPKELSEKQESSREVIWLTWIAHRNPYGQIDFYTEFHENHNATFTFVDNPKESYNLPQIALQFVDYLAQRIEQDPAREFIIFSVSMGEVWVREVYAILNQPQYQYILEKIKHNISVCGASEFENLSTLAKISSQLAISDIGKQFLWWYSKHVFNRTKNILDNKAFSPRWKKFDTILQEAYGRMKRLREQYTNLQKNTSAQKNIGKHLNDRHRQRWRTSLTKAHFDIFTLIKNTKVHSWLKTPPATILFSSDDMIYQKPEENAHNVARFYSHATEISLPDAGHVDVVFQSRKYLDAVKKTMGDIWPKEK